MDALRFKTNSVRGVGVPQPDELRRLDFGQQSSDSQRRASDFLFPHALHMDIGP
jgi:hypothetical protein